MRLSILATASALALQFVAVRSQSTTTIAAAVSTVAANSSDAPVDLFDFETLQLLDSDLDSLNETTAALFSSDNSTETNTTSKRSTASCKTGPGDPLWPVPILWDLFDLLVGGSLIKAVPINAPCHDGPYYNADRCAFLVANYSNSDIHELDPTSMMSPLYQGLTCIPTTNASLPCTQGGYPTYVVNVTNVAQIQLAVNFARSLNIRLVVKNTGHDFSGKSGGAGALSIWTHYLNSITYVKEYVDVGTGYSGPAFKAGSGVIAKDIYAAAKAQGLVVIGGEGATVGVMGGYVQGGGHSPLSSVHGMAADQVLSMEVVTASGQFVTADSVTNSDLFWALRGGGGGTFGVVTSVTVKAHPDFSAVTVVQFSFSTGGNVTAANFWAGVRSYFDYFETLTDAGMYAYFWLFPLGGTDALFIMEPLFAPGLTSAQTLAYLAPWFANLAANNIIVTPTTTTFNNFHDAWSFGFPQEAVANPDSIIGSRLFPNSFWDSKASLDTAFAAWQSSVTEQGFLTINFMIAPTAARGGNATNAVLPAWRDAYMHAINAPYWASGSNATVIKAARAALTAQQNVWKSIGTVGAYLGECDIEDPDFQTSFFGANYPELLAIKQKWDPKSVFWVRTGVGSEGLAVVTNDVIHDENGPLCST